MRDCGTREGRSGSQLGRPSSLDEVELLERGKVGKMDVIPKVPGLNEHQILKYRIARRGMVPGIDEECARVVRPLEAKVSPSRSVLGKEMLQEVIGGVPVLSPDSTSRPLAVLRARLCALLLRRSERIGFEDDKHKR